MSPFSFEAPGAEGVAAPVQEVLESANTAEAPAAKAAAKAAAKGKGGNNNKKKTCSVCEEEAEKKSSYCLDHKRAYDLLYRQAKADKDANGPQWVAWCEIFGGSHESEDGRTMIVQPGNDSLQCKVLCDYCRKFPKGRSGPKKRGTMDLTTYTKTRGSRTEASTVNQSPLYDWELFRTQMSHLRGWSSQKAFCHNWGSDFRKD